MSVKLMKWEPNSMVGMRRVKLPMSFMFLFCIFIVPSFPHRFPSTTIKNRGFFFVRDLFFWINVHAAVLRHVSITV